MLKFYTTLTFWTAFICVSQRKYFGYKFFFRIFRFGIAEIKCFDWDKPKSKRKNVKLLGSNEDNATAGMKNCYCDLFHQKMAQKVELNDADDVDRMPITPAIISKVAECLKKSPTIFAWEVRDALLYHSICSNASVPTVSQVKNC